jgi:predicted SnoaL-like aldol condensation-catalyzing enzyme
MSTEENKAVIRRWNEEIFNKKRTDRADELVTQDYVDHAALPGQTPGLEGAKQKWAMYGAAIPDLRVTIDEMVAEGDRVSSTAYNPWWNRQACSKQAPISLPRLFAVPIRAVPTDPATGAGQRVVIRGKRRRLDLRRLLVACLANSSRHRARKR